MFKYPDEILSLAFDTLQEQLTTSQTEVNYDKFNKFVGFCRERKTGEPEKHRRSKARTNNRLNPSTGPESSRATLMGGERAHNYVIPALQSYSSDKTAFEQ